MQKPEADILFESSWEICNKVGGIYTVISSKAYHMMELYKNYFVIGPYFENNAKLDFMPLEVPKEFATIFERLKNEGILCHYGRWVEVKGKPIAILIDFQGLIHQKNNLKSMYWNDYKIDSLRGYWDFEEPMLWSYATGRLIAELKYSLYKELNVVAQFHEWLSAFGLLYLKKNCPDVATVFTTHATTLGRSISGNGVDLYATLKYLDPLREAYNNNVEAKHLTEKAAALNCDIFTTVSEITAMEAEKFLGRKPEVLVLNGLDIDKFPSFEETSIKHISSRDKLQEFLTYYFFPYYTFDVTQTLIFYTVGRNEYRNKGYDILIKSLGKLNNLLKKEKQDAGLPRHIAMMFWIPMENHGHKLDVLENKNYYMHIKNYVNANAPDIMTRLIYDFISKKDIDHDLFTETFVEHIRKDIVAFERNGNPPLSTHNIDEGNNMIISSLRENGLLNRKEDLVKVIVEPVYLDGTDGFIDLSYYDAMIGCHLGLFPSYYEPWGYTPLESATLGVPALTTDLSGFGMFIKDKLTSKKGMMVLERLNKSEDYVINEFVSDLYEFSKLTHAERVECKLNAKSLSAYAEWNVLIENYVIAHNLALQKNKKSKILP
jgi:glycogen(starch) synthase